MKIEGGIHGRKLLEVAVSRAGSTDSAATLLHYSTTTTPNLRAATPVTFHRTAHYIPQRRSIFRSLSRDQHGRRDQNIECVFALGNSEFGALPTIMTDSLQVQTFTSCSLFRDFDHMTRLCFFFSNFNQQIHTIVFRFAIIFLTTLNSYMFRTLLIHHQEVH